MPESTNRPNGIDQDGSSSITKRQRLRTHLKNMSDSLEAAIAAEGNDGAMLAHLAGLPEMVKTTGRWLDELGYMPDAMGLWEQFLRAEEAMAEVLAIILATRNWSSKHIEGTFGVRPPPRGSQDDTRKALLGRAIRLLELVQSLQRDLSSNPDGGNDDKKITPNRIVEWVKGNLKDGRAKDDENRITKAGQAIINAVNGRRKGYAHFECDPSMVRGALSALDNGIPGSRQLFDVRKCALKFTG